MLLRRREPRVDPGVAEEFAEKIFSDMKDPCIELRTWNTKFDFKTRTVVKATTNTVVGGWFTEPDSFYVAVSKCSDVCSYMTVNPISTKNRPPKLRNNLGYFKKGECSSDKDILHINWIIIDIDPKSDKSRKGVNSTDEEAGLCLEKAIQISKEVHEISESDSYVGISGNGSFIMSRVNLDNTHANVNMIRSFIKDLSHDYSDEHVIIDPMSGLPSKMLAVPGSIKKKGEQSTEERPWRMVEIVSSPE